MDNALAVNIRATQSLTTEPEGAAEQAPIPRSQLPQITDPAPGRNSHDDGVSDDPEAAPFHKPKQVTRLTETEFKPKYPSRAHLNILTSKKLTKELRDVIEEEFENEEILDCYSDISTALQINDHQMIEFTVLINDKERKLSIINYDLHVKRTRETIYGVVIPNDNHKIQQDKWLWKLDAFLTAGDILKKYKIKHCELPLSSRQMPRFQKQLNQTLVIKESLIDDTDWYKVQQIKSLKGNVKVPTVTVTLTKEMWIAECKKSFQNVDVPLIPAVVNKNNNHWIEWIQIIAVESQNVYVGISCKYDEDNNKWSVQSICLDRGDIYNKHRLVGLKRDKYNAQLKNFKTSITEIKFSDNESKDIDKKMNVLRQQIKSQQDSIARLKESFLRAKNANKYNEHNGYYDDTECKVSEAEKQSIHRHIKEFIDENKDDQMEAGDACLNQIVDGVIKQCDVLDFRTNPIGAKRNIYINKQFADKTMMYYWLDCTTTMQMSQGYTKQYVNKQNRNEDDSVQSDDAWLKADNAWLNQKDREHLLVCGFIRKYSRSIYKVLVVKITYLYKLTLKRSITEQDLDAINWYNLMKLFQSQSRNHHKMKEIMAVTPEGMKQFCCRALRRSYPIPIVVVDKNDRNYYKTEWVLIVHIIHDVDNDDVGFSFRYNPQSNVFIPSSIYLHKRDIQSKHVLTGLKLDFKFKSDEHGSPSDCQCDDDVFVSSSLQRQSDCDLDINAI